MTKMIFKFFTICFLTLIVKSAFSQEIAIYGSILENGNVSSCNWYFKQNQACMELIFSDENKSKVTTRLLMNSETNILKIWTLKNGSTSCFSISADSIKPINSNLVKFIQTTYFKEFDSFGNCSKTQGRNLTSEYLIYTFENENINLNKFKSFIKNDVIFEFLSNTISNKFPVQAITTTSSGELIRSYLAEKFTKEIPDNIFNSSCE
jgi:5'-3' exonuclease